MVNHTKKANRSNLLEKLKKLTWTDSAKTLTLKDYNYQYSEFCHKDNFCSKESK